jgi:hypothetical protein
MIGNIIFRSCHAESGAEVGSVLVPHVSDSDRSERFIEQIKTKP